MSAADHEAAIREALGTANDDCEPIDTPLYVAALAALDALVGLLQQAEQAAGAEAQLADESQRFAREQRARAERAEQDAVKWQEYGLKMSDTAGVLEEALREIAELDYDRHGLRQVADAAYEIARAALAAAAAPPEAEGLGGIAPFLPMVVDMAAPPKEVSEPPAEVSGRDDQRVGQPDKVSGGSLTSPAAAPPSETP